MEQKKEKIIYFENENIKLNESELMLKSKNIRVSLGRNQSKLLWCLVRGVTCKKKIIKEIWPGVEWRLRGNNYNQLIFQTRAALIRSGFPDNTLITFPKNAICLNTNLLRPMYVREKALMESFRDQGLLNYE
ncbi:hypothetical protein ACUTQ5_19230 [Serratia sp. NA_112.1]|uniref:hypothetical protein n=1 Tax=Serratia sp. NA_112.1 TaxID=3415665 RepID=UPI004046EAC8